jgi:hypothetical protein
MMSLLKYFQMSRRAVSPPRHGAPDDAPTRPAPGSARGGPRRAPQAGHWGNQFKALVAIETQGELSQREMFRSATRRRLIIDV